MKKSSWLKLTSRAALVILALTLPIHRLSAVEASHTRPESLPAPLWLLFESLIVPWEDLRSEESTNKDNLEILGSFSVPHDYDGSGLDQIENRSRRLIFPQYGPYYLRTSWGARKILLLDPSSLRTEQALAISAFVAGNAVHSRVDIAKARSNSSVDALLNAELTKIFFASDQPLKLHCGELAQFLAGVLRTRGYEVQQISLAGLEGKGHIALQFRDEASGRFIFVDPDYAAVVRDLDGALLCLQELALRLTQNAEELRFEKLTTRYRLKSKYNSKSPVSFLWTPDKDQPKPRIEREDYFNLLTQVTASYVIRDYRGSFGWKKVESFRRQNPTPIAP